MKGTRLRFDTSEKLLTPLIEEIEKERQPNSGEESLKAASFRNLDLWVKKMLILAFEWITKSMFLGKKLKRGSDSAPFRAIL